MAPPLRIGAARSAQSLLASKPASAAPENDVTGGYQISAWAAYGGAQVQHKRYYVVDSLTGKIVDKHAEAHPCATLRGLSGGT
jgi:hypothetical protein